MKINNLAGDHDSLNGVLPSQHHAAIPVSLDDDNVRHYMMPSWFWDTVTEATLGSEQVNCIPIAVPVKQTYDRITCRILSSFTAEKVRMGIYTAEFQVNGFLRPTTVLLDAGEVDATETGSKSITIDRELGAGYYFLGIVGDENVGVEVIDKSGHWVSPVHASNSSPIAADTSTHLRSGGINGSADALPDLSEESLIGLTGNPAKIMLSRTL